MSGVGKIDISIENEHLNELKNDVKYIASDSTRNNFSPSTKIENLEIEETDDFDVQEVTPEIHEKVEKELEKNYGITKDIFSNTSANVGEGITSEVDSIDTGWEDIEYEWNHKIVPILIDSGEKVGNVIERTTATVATGATSIIEGLAGFGEAILDFSALVGTAASSTVTGVIDLGQAIRGAVTGEEWNSLTKQMWDETQQVVSQKQVETAFNSMYENTAYGNWLKDKSYAFDTVRELGKGIGYSSGVIALSLGTFGVGGALLGGAGATINVSSIQLASIAATAGVGKGTEKAWSEGASTLEGLGYGAANGLWEGIQYFVGAKIGGSTLFGENGKFLTNLSESAVKTKIINSIGRVVLDGADGGIEGFIQPILGGIYKDGSYSELFKEYGGWQNVLTQAAVGSIMSSVGEGFSGLKGIINDNKILSEDEIPTLEILTENIDDNITADIIRDYTNSDIEAKSIIDDISNLSDLSKGESVQILQKMIDTVELDDRWDIIRMAGITDDIQLDRIANKLSNLDADQINHYINENFITTESRSQPIMYLKSEIKELLGDEQKVKEIIESTNPTVYGRKNDFEKVLDISDLNNSGKIELDSIEKQNLYTILKYKPRYERSRNNMLNNYFAFHMATEYDLNAGKLCEYELGTVKNMMNYISKSSSENIKNYISTIPENSIDGLQELKLCSRVLQCIDETNVPVSSSLLENLNLLTEEYYKRISKASQNAVSFDNRYGADQHATDTIFRNEPITARERLKSAMAGKVNINQDIKDNLYRIVQGYFPTMNKADMKKYLGHIDSAGACSYATVINGIYNQFAGQEELFRRTFGYDMYRIENGKKLMNDQYLLTDLYTWANYNNKNIFDTVNNRTIYAAKGNHEEQVYLSTASKGVDVESVKEFINFMMDWSNVNMKAEVISKSPMRFDVDSQLEFRNTNQIKDWIREGLEKKEYMDISVWADHQENKEFKMYEFNSETGKFDKKFSSKNWVNSSISKEFTENRRYDGHSMNITGLTTDGITVASWGREFFIPFDEMHKIGITLSRLKLNFYDKINE